MWKYQSCSSFVFITHNSKTIQCMQILYIHVPNKCPATGALPFLVRNYVWATTGEIGPWNCLQDAICSCWDIYFFGFSHNNCKCTRMRGMLFQVWWLFIYLVFLKTTYSPMENVVVHRYLSGICSVILPILFGSWLVDIAVCVAEVWICGFNAIVAKVSSSPAQGVCC